MRAYTLAVLRDLTKSDKPIVDQDIINWANKKLTSAGKSTRVDGFKDPSIADGKVVIDLIDAIQPGCIRYELVKEAHDDEVRTTAVVNRSRLFSIFSPGKLMILLSVHKIYMILKNIVIYIHVPIRVFLYNRMAQYGLNIILHYHELQSLHESS